MGYVNGHHILYLCLLVGIIFVYPTDHLTFDSQIVLILLCLTYYSSFFISLFFILHLLILIWYCSFLLTKKVEFIEKLRDKTWRRIENKGDNVLIDNLLIDLIYIEVHAHLCILNVGELEIYLYRELWRCTPWWFLYFVICCFQWFNLGEIVGCMIIYKTLDLMNNKVVW